MRIDVTKVKRSLRGNERLIKIAKARNNGATPAALARDHGWLMLLRRGNTVGVPDEMVECYRARFEGRQAVRP